MLSVPCGTSPVPNDVTRLTSAVVATPTHRSPEDPERAAAAGRAVSVAYLLAFVVVATIGAEVWPMSSFELFSRARTGERVALEVEAIGADGSAGEVSRAELIEVDRGAPEVLSGLRARPEAEQVAVLRRWMIDTGRIDAVGSTVSWVTRRFDRRGDGSTSVVKRTTIIEVTF